MRVLFVTNMWPDEQRPWYGSFVHSQARSLRELGIDLDVLAIRGYASNWEYLRAARELLASNLRRGYDVVHAHYGHSGAVARLEVRRPLVVSYCGDDILGTPARGRPSQMSAHSRALAAAFAQISRIASATITKSREMEGKLPRAARSRNRVIPNGVDLEMFRRTDRDAARQRLGWDPHEKVALFVGNPAIERKNFPLAVRATELARVRCPSMRLRVASGVAPDEVPIWMSAADVLLHPSWSEGSPNAVKEAMACQMPVVATPAGDVPERLSGIVGCHVLPPDAAAFADGLLDAIEHCPCPPARDAVAHLSLERVAREIIGVYEAVGSA